MARYIEHQTRKIVTSYGGVGSIIETPEGSILIEDFEKWPLFRPFQNEDVRVDVDDWKITDNRLLKRLQHLKGFPKLKEFIRIPPNFAHHVRKNEPADPDRVISAEYFPRWFYCSNCDRFMPLNEWWNLWESTLQKFGERAERKKFIPPKCYHCYDKAKSDNKKGRAFLYNLEQVRFIMTSPIGEIKDIQWEKWPTALKEVKEESSEKGKIRLQGKCCEHQDLRYYKSPKFSDLAGVRIECVACGAKNTLSGIFGLWFPVPNMPQGAKEKVVLRASNSVYYPITVNSVYLPTQKEISPEDQDKIEKWVEKGKDTDFIFEALLGKYEKVKLEKFVKGDFERVYEPEIEYRLREYVFLTDEERKRYPNKDEIDSNLIFERNEIEQLEKYRISNLTAIKRLKITTVQIAYTRQEPLDKDQFLNGETITDAKIEAKYTSSWGRDTEYLPAVESFGEGIFLALDNDEIIRWIKTNDSNKSFTRRIDKLWENCSQHEYLCVTRKFQNKEHLVRFVLMHTLSHLLMKELEFLCGYPVTSLSERLFVDNEKMQGVLIYTVAGAEGSYGGLVSQATERNFLRIIKSALKRADDCASDPICYHTDDGQGIGGLNMAACYSCTLIPENACEEFNSFLDRALLIDNEFGFYGKL